MIKSNVNQLVGPFKIVKEKQVKTGERKESKKDLIIAEYKKQGGNDKIDYKLIADTLKVKENTVYVTIKTYRITCLFESGKSEKEISEKLGMKLESVKNFIERNFS